MPRKTLIATLAAAVILTALPAHALTVKDFDAKPAKEQSAYVVDFIQKMTADIWTKNPKLAQDIRDWFATKREGKAGSEGVERLYVELTALDLLAKDGKVDLSKIQVEGVIVKVVKDKFPPPGALAEKP